MLFTSFAFLLALFSGCVIAQPATFISSPAARQAGPSTDCNNTCITYQELTNDCTAPYCECAIPFIQSQGECLLCMSSTPQDAANVQFRLETNMSQCQSKGINIQFQLDLPPAAAAIVQNFNRESAYLRRSQKAFLALQIAGGHIGLVIVLSYAIFSREHRRGPIFLNFCITWIFSSIVFSILLYRGTDGHTVTNTLGSVSPDLCLMQAALTKGVQVMTACSTLVLIINLWLGLSATIPGKPAYGPKQSRWITYASIVIPYVFFIGFALPSVLNGTGQVVVQGVSFQKASPTNFYCAVIRLHASLEAIDSITLALLLIAMVFDVLIMKFLYKHWRAYRHIETNGAVPLSCLLRVMAFSLFRVAVAVTYVRALFEMTPGVLGNSPAAAFSVSIWTDLLQAAIPLVAFLIYGSNPDAIKHTISSCMSRFGSTSKARRSNIEHIRADNAKKEETDVEADNKFEGIAV